MATDINILMGEIVNDPINEEKNAEKLLVGLLHSLIEEQKMMDLKPKHEPQTELK